MADIGPVAVCSHCGFAFESRQFRFPGSTEVKLQGNTEQCIRCGKTADLVDGVYGHVNGVSSFVASGKVTIEQLEKVRKLIGSGVAVSTAFDRAKVNKVVASPMRWLAPTAVLGILAILISLAAYANDVKSGRAVAAQMNVQTDLLRSMLGAITADDPHLTEHDRQAEKLRDKVERATVETAVQKTAEQEAKTEG